MAKIAMDMGTQRMRRLWRVYRRYENRIERKQLHKNDESRRAREKREAMRYEEQAEPINLHGYWDVGDY